jgi:hypothetical protein
MATKLVRYEFAGGGSVVVEEQTEDRGGLVGRGDVVETAGRKFEEALATLRPAAAAVIEAVEGLVARPEEVTLELGFTLKGELGKANSARSLPERRPRAPSSCRSSGSRAQRQPHGAPPPRARISTRLRPHRQTEAEGKPGAGTRRPPSQSAPSMSNGLGRSAQQWPMTHDNPCLSCSCLSLVGSPHSLAPLPSPALPDWHGRPHTAPQAAPYVRRANGGS